MIENQFFICGKSKISKFMSPDLRKGGGEIYNIGSIYKESKNVLLQPCKAFNFPFVLYSYNAKPTFFQPYPNEMLS